MRGGGVVHAEVGGSRGVSCKASRPVPPAGAANCLEWSQGNEHVCLTSGFDPDIRVYDVRRPGEALHVLSGHCGPKGGGIYRPLFVNRCGTSSTDYWT